MVRWAIWAIVLGGCIEPALVECSDGRTCPVGRACDVAHHGCVDPDQLAECEGEPDFTLCVATGVPDGRCFDGVCLPRGCGNGVIEPGELCDDGNTVGNDGCSADCNSLEVCGDGFVDHQRGEECDDGNLRAHDGCTSACAIEDLVWRDLGIEPLTVQSKLPRRAAAVGYDPERRRLVAFGGIDANSIGFHDTWEWNGHLWSRLGPATSPTGRVLAPTAYDLRHHRLVMFGGESDEMPAWLNDTWEWDGVNWYRMHPTTSPSARAASSMVWDGHSVLVFGGDGGVKRLDDLWRWDGDEWHLVPVASAPPPRAGFAMVYDARHDRVVVFGGQDGGTNFADTWIFDGTSWSSLTGAGPPALVGATATYDPIRGVIVLSGTATTTQVTWELDGNTWTDRHPTSVPDMVLEFGMVFDLELGRVVQFDGITSAATVSSDLWQWNSATATWSKHSPDPDPPPREFAALADDPERGRVVMFGGLFVAPTSPLTPLSDLWEWDGRTWHQPAPTGAAPSARFDAATVYDPISKSVLVIGGTQTGAGLAEMWSWNGTSWSQYPGALPPARHGAGIAYDSDRKRVVLFGGVTLSQPAKGDTWEWDGTSWSERTPAVSPPARVFGRMAYDPVRHKTLLFGGTPGAVVDSLSDTWEWDGTTWTQRMPFMSPDPRSAHVMVYDRARRRISMFGGTVAYFSPWEWDGDTWSQQSTLTEPPLLGGPAATYDTTRGELVLFGGGLGNTLSFNQTWTASYVGVNEEICESGVDVDGDGASGCADSDCALACSPDCYGDAPCTDGPQCGDGVCSPIETDRTCPADCAPTSSLCGDGYCAPGEACTVDCS